MHALVDVRDRDFDVTFQKGTRWLPEGRRSARGNDTSTECFVCAEPSENQSIEGRIC